MRPSFRFMPSISFCLSSSLVSVPFETTHLIPCEEVQFCCFKFGAILPTGSRCAETDRVSSSGDAKDRCNLEKNLERERKISRCLEWINRFRNYQFHSWKVNIGKIVLFVSLSTIINFYALERWECLFFKNFLLFLSLLQSYEVSWNNNRRIGGFSQFVNTFLPSSTSLLFSSLLMLIIL